jgi:hypothetical protein
MEAKILGSGGTELTRTLAPIQDGKHEVAFVPLKDETYTVTAKAYLSGTELSVREDTIEIVSLPSQRILSHFQPSTLVAGTPPSLPRV